MKIKIRTIGLQQIHRLHTSLHRSDNRHRNHSGILNERDLTYPETKSEILQTSRHPTRLEIPWNDAWNKYSQTTFKFIRVTRVQSRWSSWGEKWEINLHWAQSKDILILNTRHIEGFFRKECGSLRSSLSPCTWRQIKVPLLSGVGRVSQVPCVSAVASLLLSSAAQICERGGRIGGRGMLKDGDL